VFDSFLPFEFLSESVESLRDSGHLLVSYQFSLTYQATCLFSFFEKLQRCTRFVVVHNTYIHALLLENPLTYVG
jgi:hypothetical protein